MIYLPVIGAFLESIGVILEKKLLRLKGMNFKNYTVFEFLAICLISLPLIYFTWNLESEAFFIKNIIILIAVIIISVLANLLIFYSLKREHVTEFEPIWLMQPLFVIFLAFILFESERNPILMYLAIIASLTLILSHVKKHHLKINKYIISAILGNLFFALELILSKFILEYYSGFTFYFIRCLGIFLITLLLFKPKFKIINKKSGFMLAVIGAIWIFYRVIMYYGFINLGVIYTTLLFILSGVFMFILAVVFLKEKPTIRHIISTIVILTCVALAVLIG